MADRTSTLTFLGRDAVSGVAGKVEGSLGRMHGTANRLSGGLGRLGGGILGVGKHLFSLQGLLLGGGIIAGLSAAADAAANDEASTARLTTAIGHNVKGHGDYTAALEKTIAAGQRLAFSDDETRASLARLVTSTHDVAEATRLNGLAMDLARLKGIPLADAANLIGKVHDGNVGILKRYGIEVKKGATATEALAAVQKAAAGQATAFADTSAGGLARLKDGFGEAMEAVGKVVIPIMGKLVGFLNDAVIPAIGVIIATIQGWVTANQPLIDQIGAFVSGVLTTLGTFVTGTLIPAVGTVAAAVGDWFTANQPLFEQIATFASGALTTLGTFTNDTLLPAIRGVAAAVGAWFAANQPLVDQIKGFADGALKLLGDGIKWVSDNLNIVIPFIAGVAVVAIANWAIGMAAVAAAHVAALGPIIAVHAAELLALAPLALIGAAIGVLAVAWVNNWGGIQDKVEAVVRVIQPILETVIVPAIQKVIDIVVKVATEFGHFFNDVIQPAIGPVLGALGGIFNTVIVPAAQAVFDVVQTLADVFSRLFDRVIHPALDPILGVLRTVLDGIAKAAGAVGDFVRAAMGPIKDFLGVIGEVIGALQRMLDLAAQAARSLPGTGTVHRDPLADLGHALFGDGRSHGGPVTAGRTYMVGERGPELFSPGQSGSITPNSALGGTINATFNISGADDPETIARSVMQALQRERLRQGMSLGR